VNGKGKSGACATNLSVSLAVTAQYVMLSRDSVYKDWIQRSAFDGQQWNLTFLFAKVRSHRPKQASILHPDQW
jgi:hypothetical protein